MQGNRKARSLHRSATGVGLLAVALMTWGGASRAEDGFAVLRVEDGIEISTKDEPGRALPIMRGKGNVHGNVLQVLAVILDAPRSVEWAEGASAVEYVGTPSTEHALIYSLTKLTWPVSDRDLIVERSTVAVTRGEVYKVAYVGKPDARPRREGTVRCPDAMLSFTIKKVDEATTFVDYQARVDPGGRLPKWLVRWAAKNLPYKTLKRLDEQLARTRGAYGAEIAALRAQ